MSKPNFYVDPDFPVIDGVGHADKQAFVNVKGGGSTNTTMFDALAPSEHWFICSKDPTAIPPMTTANAFSNSDFDPTLSDAAVLSPGCLNGIRMGDNRMNRCSDKVLLDRIIVNGSVVRPSGIWWDIDGVNTVGTPYATPDPKCFIALVADLATSGAAWAPDDVFDSAMGRKTGGIEVQGVPWLDQTRLWKYRVLAHTILDFADQPPLALSLTNQFIFDGVTWQRTDSNTSYVYRAASKGFRFDVDLNGALCSFRSDTGLIDSIVDLSLHMFAVWFDGDSAGGAAITGSMFNLGLNYQSMLYFRDFLSPQSFAPAGVDGPVVDDAAPDLDVLADQSAILAGDALEPSRKKTKASEGFFNFRPRRDPALLAFPDDFERTRLWSGKRSKSRPGKGRKFRRTDDEPDYYGEEMEPAPRRGKY